MAGVDKTVVNGWAFFDLSEKYMLLRLFILIKTAFLKALIFASDTTEVAINRK